MTPEKKQKRAKLTTDVPGDKYEALRTYMEAHGQTLRWTVEKMIDQYLANVSAVAKSAPPHSKAHSMNLRRAHRSCSGEFRSPTTTAIASTVPKPERKQASNWRRFSLSVSTPASWPKR